MSWKTRNIRRRNKGKKTKGRKQKQRGGLGGPPLDAIIKHLIKSPPDDGVPVHMESKSIMKNTPFLGPFKIKFVDGNKFKIIALFEGFKGNTSDTYKYSITGAIKKIEITADNLATKAGINGKLLVIENIKEIDDAMGEKERQIINDKKETLTKSINDNNVKIDVPLEDKPIPEEIKEEENKTVETPVETVETPTETPVETPETPVETTETTEENKTETTVETPETPVETPTEEENKTETTVETTETPTETTETTETTEEENKIVDEVPITAQVITPAVEPLIQPVQQLQPTTSIQPVQQLQPTTSMQPVQQLQPTTSMQPDTTTIPTLQTQAITPLIPPVNVDALKTKLDESIKKLKEELKLFLDKLKTKYASVSPVSTTLTSATNQLGGAVSLQIDTLIQKHPELASTNIKQLFDNVPEDVSTELGAEDILKSVSDSAVKVEPNDPFITELTTEISSIKQSSDVVKQGQSSITTTAVSPSVPQPLTLDDLKLSPELKHPSSGESGKYIFVPLDKVQTTIDFLLSNGCEITTTVL
jgi:hypothetical protein